LGIRYRMSVRHITRFIVFFLILFIIICKGKNRGLVEVSDTSSTSSFFSSYSSAIPSASCSGTSSSSVYNFNRLLNMDYEKGTINNDLSDIGQGSDNVFYALNAISSNTRDGLYALRVELRDTNEMVYGGTRAECDADGILTCRYIPGDNFYYGFSIYIPFPWPADDEIAPYADIIFQWKHTAAGPDAMLISKHDRWYLRYNYGEPAAPVKMQIELTTDLNEDKWNDFIFHFKWFTNLQGLIEVWHKTDSQSTYDKILSTNTPNCMNYHNIAGGEHGYIKWGLYCPKWNETNKTSVSRRILFYDNIRVSSNNRNEVDPGL